MFLFQNEGMLLGTGKSRSFKVYDAAGVAKATPLFPLTLAPDISNAEDATKVLMRGILARVPSNAIISPGYDVEAVGILGKGLDKRVQICDKFQCFRPGDFQASLMAGLTGDSKAFYEGMRPSLASNEARVGYLTNEITFLYTHDFQGRIEYSNTKNAVKKVCQDFNVDKEKLLQLLGSKGNSEKLTAVSVQDGKTYIIMKGYRSGTLAIFESNGKAPSKEYINEKLNAINDSTSFITAVYAARFSQLKGKAVSNIVFNRGVAEISLGAEQLTLDMGGIIYETMNSMVGEKHVTWKRPAKQAVLTTASLGAVGDCLAARAASPIDVEKEYDAKFGKGAFDSFANQTFSGLYSLYLRTWQSAQPGVGTNDAFMNTILADMQTRSSVKDMQETSTFAYGISKKKKEEKDEQDSKTGGGFA